MAVAAGNLVTHGPASKGIERRAGGLGVGGAIDGAQRRRERLAIFPPGKVEATAEEMDDTGRAARRSPARLRWTAASSSS